MHGAGRDSLITETLRGSRTRCPCHDISDSALKVVLSYYPVCRCQRTSPHVHFRRQKKLNLVSPTIDPRLSGYRCRDKIESNLQSQMYVEQTPSERSPRFSGVKKLIRGSPASTGFSRFFHCRPVLPQMRTAEIIMSHENVFCMP